MEGKEIEERGFAPLSPRSPSLNKLIREGDKGDRFPSKLN